MAVAANAPIRVASASAVLTPAALAFAPAPQGVQSPDMRQLSPRRPEADAAVTRFKREATAIFESYFGLARAGPCSGVSGGCDGRAAGAAAAAAPTIAVGGAVGRLPPDAIAASSAGACGVSTAKGRTGPRPVEGGRAQEAFAPAVFIGAGVAAPAVAVSSNVTALRADHQRGVVDEVTQHLLDARDRIEAVEAEFTQIMGDFEAYGRSWPSAAPASSIAAPAPATMAAPMAAIVAEPVAEPVASGTPVARLPEYHYINTPHGPWPREGVSSIYSASSSVSPPRVSIGQARALGAWTRPTPRALRPFLSRSDASVA